MTDPTARFLRAILCAAAALLLPAASNATDGPSGESRAGPLAAKGYLIARYSYVGSSSPGTVYSATRLTGSLSLSAMRDRVTLRFRSHSWLHFQRTEKRVLWSPFDDRTVLQSLSLQTRDLLLPGLTSELGRFFPELDYGSVPPIDGAALAYERHGFSAGLAGGWSADPWNGETGTGGSLAIVRGRYRTERLSASAGFQIRDRSGARQRELPAGVSLSLGKGLRAEAYGAYDFSFGEVVRGGAGLSWLGRDAAVSLAVSRWRNPFEQLWLLDREGGLPSWGLDSPPMASTFDDARATCSYARGGWRVRGALGIMNGARSGWSASSYLTAPPFFGFVFSLGGQGMRSDFAELSAIDAGLDREIGGLLLRVESQTRNYLWRPSASSLHITDNYSEISIEYPLGRHISVRAEAGGFLRTLGPERFKPQAAVRLQARL